MKRILFLVLLLAMVCMLFACNKPNEENPDNGGTQTPNEKTYSFAVVVDSALGRGNKNTNIGLAIVFDEAGKIVAARFDSNEIAPELNADGTVKAVESVASKVEQGESYEGMPAGDWKTQAGVFENAIAGKTAEEVANLEASAYAGCTMATSVPVFKALVAKAAALENKVTFTTAASFTTGIAMDMTVAANRGKTAAEVTADIAGVVVAGGKVIACAMDSVIQSYAIVTEGETKTLAAPETLAASKNEKGDDYVMPAGNWLNQAKAFCAAIVGLDAAGLEAFAPVSDALASAGCTMKSTPAGYKVTIISAFGYAR